MKLLLSLLFILHLKAECVPVTGSRILGSDLARADHRYSSLPASLILGFTPPPGTPRVFHAAELDRLARASGLQTGAAEDVCFTLPVQKIDLKESESAMLRALPAGSHLEVVALSPEPAPAGELVFPIDALEAPVLANGSAKWRGFVIYAENRRAPIWADVRAAIPFTSVIAAAALPADVAIPASSLRQITGTSPVPRSAVSVRIDEIAGLAPRTPIHEGASIHRSDLITAPAVRRGDSIRIEVLSGSARLHFDAVMEGSARIGDIVELHSPLNGKSFKARLESSSSAVVAVEGDRK